MNVAKHPPWNALLCNEILFRPDGVNPGRSGKVVVALEGFCSVVQTGGLQLALLGVRLDKSPRPEPFEDELGVEVGRERDPHKTHYGSPVAC